MIDVSVIVPVYNAEQFIDKCANSLFSQTLRSIEFIFVNDCSTDNSETILRGLFRKYPDVRIILKTLDKNSGVSIARATGISIAKGKYIGFCDSDDWLEDNMYEYMFKVAEKEDADIVGCGFVEHQDGFKTSYTYKKGYDDVNTIFDFSCFGGIYGALWNKIIRTDFLKSNYCNIWEGLSMWEDSCLLIPLRLKSRRTVFINCCLYHYNVHQGSLTTQQYINKVHSSAEATRRLEDYFRKEGFIKESERLIQNLKITSKEVLLRYPSKSNAVLFRSTFPEVNKHLLTYPNWNLFLRLRAWLVAVLPFILSLLVLRIARK